MGFDVYGPNRHVCVSNVDFSPTYDIFPMPEQLGLQCPQLEKLNQRYYEDTVLDNNDGSIEALRDELIRLRKAYRAQQEPALILERKVRAKDPAMRRAVLDRLLDDDPVFRAIEEFRQLCDEAIAAEVPIQCVGD